MTSNCKSPPPPIVCRYATGLIDTRGFSKALTNTLCSVERFNDGPSGCRCSAAHRQRGTAAFKIPNKANLCTGVICGDFVKQRQSSNESAHKF